MLAALSRRTALPFADLYKREQSVKVPFLAFKGDIERDHPVINDLRRDYRPAAALRRIRRKCGGGHGSLNVLFYLRNIFLRKTAVDLVRNILRKRHAPHIVGYLLRGLVLPRQERFVPPCFPF